MFAPRSGAAWLEQRIISVIRRVAAGRGLSHEWTRKQCGSHWVIFTFTIRPYGAVLPLYENRLPTVRRYAAGPQRFSDNDRETLC